MKSWLVILGLWALVGLYWRGHGMGSDLHAARHWIERRMSNFVDK